MELLFHIRAFEYTNHFQRFVNINKIKQNQIVSITNNRGYNRLYFYYAGNLLIDQYNYLPEDRKEKYRLIKEYLDKWGKSHLYEYLYPVNTKYDYHSSLEFDVNNYEGLNKKTDRDNFNLPVAGYDLFDFLKDFQEYGPDEFED
jgi:hypothetical protein